VIDGFYRYQAKPEVVKKINAIRINQSRPDLCGVPILQPGQAMFSPAASAHDEPRSCYNCFMFNETAESCAILPEHIKIRKFTSPLKREDNAKPIEFWPVCGYWIHGTPNMGPAIHHAEISPEDAGLSWINAPEPGQEYGGACCGGRNGGDDCDFWMISSESGDKRAEDTGFCRVLQTDTANMDCCACWIDDDILDWRMVQERFNEK
jgi:hypothetical protein